MANAAWCMMGTGTPGAVDRARRGIGIGLSFRFYGIARTSTGISHIDGTGTGTGTSTWSTVGSTRSCIMIHPVPTKELMSQIDSVTSTSSPTLIEFQ